MKLIRVIFIIYFWVFLIPKTRYIFWYFRSVCLCYFLYIIYLTLSWRGPLLYRNQSIDLLCKSIDWFLYDNCLRHERVNLVGPSCNMAYRCRPRRISRYFGMPQKTLQRLQRFQELCNNGWRLSLDVFGSLETNES